MPQVAWDLTLSVSSSCERLAGNRSVIPEEDSDLLPIYETKVLSGDWIEVQRR